ncbi:hypothetical protein RchiOBHm_Chr2g0159741 [Rosa chinensis]|uniref:Uncharacterized protein n=1 Tax=Rosa chinensis TaxID=74649 RepID=A0A2P6S2C6_ROSCH|nr:hypothetical protein RchiOBHm_Chr2g0159741 [Rosa chinensis]
MSYLKLGIMNLSSSGLPGEITSCISNLDMLHLCRYSKLDNLAIADFMCAYICSNFIN